MEKAKQCSLNAYAEQINLADILAGIWNSKTMAGDILKRYMCKEEFLTAVQNYNDRPPKEKFSIEEVKRIQENWELLSLNILEKLNPKSLLELNKSPLFKGSPIVPAVAQMMVKALEDALK
jgi:hypothetical protein